MRFNILHTEPIYRRLLAEPDPSARQAIFCDELVAPFAGLIRMFGGSPANGLAAFAQWGMSPDHFGGERRAEFAQIVEGLAAGDAWNRAARSLERGWAACERYHDRIPTPEITFALTIADMSAMPGQRGYSGFGAMPGYIMTTYYSPDDYTLARVEAATVHELHHNILSAVTPPRNFMTEVTVADYMVMEGLAESFAQELYGPDVIGYFVTDFDMSRLEETRAKFRAALTLTGFNTIRGYIFGEGIGGSMGIEKVDVPAFAGYALGYHVVQAYLQRTGQSVVEATFVPAEQIIAESRYFES